MTKIIKSTTPTGDTIWKTETDGLPVSNFIEEYPHDDWTLEIEDTLSADTITIDCTCDNLLTAIGYVYVTEHAEPMKYIREDHEHKRYVVGMPFVKGRIKVPAKYVWDDGLKEVDE